MSMGINGAEYDERSVVRMGIEMMEVQPDVLRNYGKRRTRLNDFNCIYDMNVCGHVCVRERERDRVA